MSQNGYGDYKYFGASTYLNRRTWKNRQKHWSKRYGKLANIAEKSKTGPELSLVEGVIPSKIIANVTYSGFIVKYNN